MDFRRLDGKIVDIRMTGPEWAKMAFDGVVESVAEGDLLTVFVLDHDQHPRYVAVEVGGLEKAEHWMRSFVLPLVSEVGAPAVVLVVNRPGGLTLPEPADLPVWQELRRTCLGAKVKLLDLLILSEHRWRSMAETAEE
jgi:DNA repair protein RadC